MTNIHYISSYICRILKSGLIARMGRHIRLLDQHTAGKAGLTSSQTGTKRPKPAYGWARPK
jgi:hypothetical protein